MKITKENHRTIFSTLTALITLILGASSPAFATDIQTQIDNVLATDGTSVTLTPGTYIVPSGNAIDLTDTTDFTINASDVNIVMGTFTAAIVLSNCGNVQINHGSIDYDHLPFVEGAINSVTHGTSHQILSANVTFDANGLSTLVTGESGLGISRGMIIDTSTNELKKGSATLNVDSVDTDGDGTYTVTFDPCDSVVDTTTDGDEISFPVAASFSDGSNIDAIDLEQCGSCTIQAMTIYSSPAIGIQDLDAGTGTTSDGNSYLSCNIVPNSGRIRATNAGGIVCRKTTAGPTIKTNTLEYLGDDAIAVHTYMAQVVSAVADSTTCTVQTRVPIGNLGLFGNGHVVKFFVPNDSGIFGTESPAYTTATDSGGPSLVTDGGPGTTSDCATSDYTLWTYTLTFTSPLTLPANTWLEDSSESADGFVVQGNTIATTRARGIYARGDDGDVDNNTISYTAMAGILVEPEVVVQTPYYGEGNLTNGMSINNNNISNAVWGWSNKRDNAAGAISVLVQDPTWGPWGHTNMSIEGNTLNNCAGVQVLLQSTQTCTVSGNTFNYPGVNNVAPSYGSALASPNAGYSVVDGTSTTCDALVWVSNVDTVTFKNNNIYYATDGADGRSLYDYDGCTDSPTMPPTDSEETNITLVDGLSSAFNWH